MARYARLEVYESKDRSPKQRWRWRLVSRNGNIVAIGSEGYARPSVAEQAALDVINGGYDVTGRIERVHAT
jgi:uncharacterized protein YegP (UPF0339 family)